MRNETQGENGIVFEGIRSEIFFNLKRASDISPISSSAPRPLGAAFVPILLSEGECEYTGHAPTKESESTEHSVRQY